MDNQKRHYSADVIRRYREMQRKNAFRRKRIPIDLDTDKVIFTCGHTQEWSARLVDNMPEGRKFDCEHCAKEWLAKAVQKEKRKKK